MRYVLIFLVIILALSSFILFTTYNTTQKELAKQHKAKTLCQGKIKDCEKKLPGVPKGVCAPGGICT